MLKRMPGTGFLAAALIALSLVSHAFAVPFDTIDAYAINAPRSAEKSVESLATYLTRSAASEKAKVRALYRWITHHIAYDTAAYFSGSYATRNLTPMDIITGRKAVCGEYAELFNALAKAAGLESRMVIGYSKGYGYAVGSSKDQPNHAWNAVRIDGQWQLIDITWAAGYLDNQGHFVRRLTDHYFLTAPSRLIYDHYPEDKRWQLLEQDFPLEQYRRLAYLGPAFFALGLKLGKHIESVVEAEDNPLVIPLFAPPGVTLSATLVAGQRELEQQTLVQQEGDGAVQIHALLPKPGQYVLNVFAKDTRSRDQYAWVVTYEIRSAMPARNMEFPAVYTGFSERGAYLETPLSGPLKAGSSQLFKLKVPGAEKVSVIIGSDWHSLTRQGEWFQGQVRLSGSEAGVYAQFAGESEYTGLLKYSVR